jgi:putative nucleotidyltransferase with HDIG domain
VNTPGRPVTGSFRAKPRSPATLVHDGRDHERAGCIPEAVAAYEAAIDAAEKGNDQAVLAEALRRLGAVSDRRDDLTRARELCERSYHVSLGIANEFLAAEALNVLGIVEMHAGHMTVARQTFEKALTLGAVHGDLSARVERNLGVVASIEGDVDEALDHYNRSLEASRAANDEHGCGIAYVNLGIACRQLGRFDEADEYFSLCFDIAERAGDVHLKAACHVNHAELHVFRQRYDDARRNAESALAIFDQLGARADKAEAYRVIGVVYRETGRSALAESRLRSSIELSVASGSTLKEAEASHELAVLYQTMGRNQEALAMLNAAHRLFGDLHARRDLVNISGKVEQLESTYLQVVREWGQSIESSDTYTYGHCGRVAENAVAVARRLGFAEQDLTAIRLGAYLHDVGKVNVPHEVLNKPGPLTREEFEIVQNHPIWGVELLDEVEFPWDIKSVIRWHHEKYDGTGYPDRLKGDEIPLPAQVVGIVDVYDALTTDRPYRKALTHEHAMADITTMRASWSSPVFDAFVSSVGSGAVSTAVPN